MSAASDRTQMHFSFAYPSGPAYGSTSSSAFNSGTSVAINALEPVVGAVAVVINRDTGYPAKVYQGETGTSVLTSLTTDAQGSVPGWVSSGSYTLQVASQGSFAGAAISFEAVRGDGVTLVAPGAVTRITIANNAVDMPQLSPAVQALLNSIAGLSAAITAALAGRVGLPAGLISFAYVVPPGWLPLQPVSFYPTLPGGGPVIAPILSYPALFVQVGYMFSAPASPPPAGYFVLPTAFLQPPSPFQTTANQIAMVKY